MQRVSVQPGSVVDVAIIGAGPYGLSIAAHLAAKGIPFRIFGKPMSAWSTQMPQGMHLKSEGFASNLSHPEGKFALRDFCRQQRIPYQDTGLPVKLETFVSYGLAFQKQFVSNLEEKLVTGVLPSTVGFELELDDGEKVHSRKVVVATGICRFAKMPEILTSLPSETVSHSSEHSSLERFRDRRVAVVGAGASALDVLTLLHEGGARVQLISRRSTVRFHDPPQPRRSLKDRLTRPVTGIGSGMELFFCANTPGLFRLLPQWVRLDRVRKVLGPAPGWFIKDRIAGKVPFHLGVEITRASVQNGRVELELANAEGLNKTIEVDHVIAATGYGVDLERLDFLCPVLRKQIRLTEKAPALSADFESSVRGLYFVGVAAANTFGPLLRFAYGSAFVAARLARHFNKLAPRVTTDQASDKAEIYGRG